MNLSKFIIIFLISYCIPHIHSQESFNRFLSFEDEIIEYMRPNDLDYKTEILMSKKEEKEKGLKYDYLYHKKIAEFCNYEFYSFQEGSICFHCTKYIAMIDNEKNTIAFLDTLTLTQTMDSIQNVIKDCEQTTTPKELNDFFEKIKSIYHHNEINSILLRGTYSSPSQVVVYLLSAEKALEFEKAKYYIDYERIYNTQQEWELKVRTNPPKLDFHNYWFTVKENGRYATVTTRYKEQKTKYYLRQERYYSKSWKIVGIESD